jgi:hypothetical protein
MGGSVDPHDLEPPSKPHKSDLAGFDPAKAGEPQACLARRCVDWSLAAPDQRLDFATRVS